MRFFASENRNCNSLNIAEISLFHIIHTQHTDLNLQKYFATLYYFVEGFIVNNLEDYRDDSVAKPVA